MRVTFPVVLVLALSVAQAQVAPPASEAGARFRTFDENQDNRISLQEWRRFWVEGFRAQDTDRNRRLTRAEFGGGGEADLRFLRLDGDRNAQITRRELIGWADWRFGVLDADRNGLLYWSEMSADRSLPGGER